jgi:hypothetical protein
MFFILPLTLDFYCFIVDVEHVENDIFFCQIITPYRPGKCDRDETGIALSRRDDQDPGLGGIPVKVGSRFEVGSRFGWDPGQKGGIPVDQGYNCVK